MTSPSLARKVLFIASLSPFVLAACDNGAPVTATGLASLSALPRDLRDTGLYSDWNSRTVDPANRSYTPGFALWSDGAAKSRWVHLPPGAQIDITDMDEWHFPVGTAFWKEFRYDLKQADGSVKKDQKIETRLIWKRGEGDWQMGTYVWSSDQQSATLASAADPPPVPFPGTDTYEVPVVRCHTCHDLRGDKVLGFEGLLLAAPEADQNGITWQKLLDEKLVTPAAAAPANDKMQFLSNASDVERKAAGYLHVNCGVTCHHGHSKEVTPFYMRLEWNPLEHFPQKIDETLVFMTAINVQSDFVPRGQSGVFYAIRPGDVSRSTVPYRINVRNGLRGGGEQMPQVDSHRVDEQGVMLIRQWVESMTQAPYPVPAP